MKPKLIAIALLLALAGCGGDQSNNGVASAGGPASAKPGAADPAAGLSQQEKALKWVQCMREHGIDLPDPDPATGRVQVRVGPDTPREKMQAAQEACKAWQPFGEGSQGANPQQLEAQRKFAQCVRDNGVPTFPDPQGGGIRIDPSTGNDPDWPAAQEKCRPLLQAGQGSPR